MHKGSVFECVTDDRYLFFAGGSTPDTYILDPDSLTITSGPAFPAGISSAIVIPLVD